VVDGEQFNGRACFKGWCARFRVRQGVQYSTGSGGFSVDGEQFQRVSVFRVVCKA
jgi:hypothetical protein